MIGATAPRSLDFMFSAENIELMKKAKIKYLRVPSYFPFADAGMDKVSDTYADSVKVVRKLKEIGIESFVSFPCAGSYRYNPQTGKTEFIRTVPDWLGTFEDDIFYERIEKATEFLGRDLKELTPWWQVANEPDIDTFIGMFTHEQNARYLRTIAKGLKKGNPNAQCGINIAGCAVMGGEGPGVLNYVHVHTYAAELISQLYTDEGLFDYMGLDAYFGTWSPGKPSDWVKYIDDAARVSKKPVIINEWGYSTLQRGAPRPPEDKKRKFNSAICREKDWDAEGNTNKWLGQDHSEKLQSDYNKECVKIFSEHPAVIGNLYFQWQDQSSCWQCGDPDCPAECAWGCIRTDGTPKPGYYGLAEANAEYFD
jgi:hypothetical protein